MSALIGGKGLQLDRRGICPALSPAGPFGEKFGAGEAQDEDRRASGPVDDVLDEVQERGFRPVGVLEDDDDGTPSSQRLE
ncbi:MAG: hypothetical protein LC733_00540 [Actinobacteria bacterium]|nr:hypothetical protein [Actinomycetota bacterium]